MSDPRRDRGAAIQDDIRAILVRDWDPLNVRDGGPKDEYDSYIGPIYCLLSSGALRSEIAAALSRIERDQMGYDRVSADALLPVADRLKAIQVSA
jgi:hypothetical protein